MKKRWIVLAASSLVTTASAQPAASAQAEVLFNDAKALMTQKKFAEACSKFESSQALDPAITTLINLGDCREKNGQLTTAWGIFTEVERQARGDKGEAKLASVAQLRAQKLGTRLSKLTIQVASDARLAGLEVKLDDRAVLPGSWGSALPLDGGHYKIKATAPNAQPWSTELDIAAEHDAKVVDVPKLGAAATTVGEVDRAGARATHAEAPSHSHTGAVVATVAAVALAGGSIGFELWGRGLLDDAGKEPDNTRQSALYDDANTRHYVAQGLGVAAIGVTGVAIYLWVRGGHDPKAETAMLVVPSLGADHVGLTLSRSY
ncbi:hypothetical protein BH11MYX1_BH11MYX1_19380 [soil metagenome]